MLSGWKLCRTSDKKDEFCARQKESSVCSRSAAGGSGTNSDISGKNKNQKNRKDSFLFFVFLLFFFLK